MAYSVKVAILIPSINDYIRGSDGNPIYFSSHNEALQYLADHNCSAQEMACYVYEVLT
jgi:hypothetical protein